MGSSRAAWVLVLGMAGALAPPRPRGAFPRLPFSARMITASPILSPVTMRIAHSGAWWSVRLPHGARLWLNSKTRRAYRWLPSGLCAAVPFRPPPGLQPFLWRGQVRRKLLGTGTLRGYAAVILQITVRRRGRPSVVFTAWTAPALGGLPLRIQMLTPSGPLEIQYHDLRLRAPAGMPPPGAEMSGMPLACVPSRSARPG
jgi:hypothetical protein